MKILKLILNDFRCFESFEINFSSEHNLHVIIAENMVGKSAIMAGLKLALNTYTMGIKSEKQLAVSDHRVIGNNPIADIAPQLSIEATALLDKNFDQIIESSWLKYKTKPHGERTKIHILKGLDPRKVAIENLKSAATGKAINPLLGFIGTEYIHVESSETVTWEINGKSTDGYKGCFDDKSIKKFLFKWIGRMDGIIEEMSRKSIIKESYGEIPNRAIEVFQNAVISILPDVTHIEWSADAKQPIVKFKDGSIRLFSMVSDGYRYLILLAGELATRAFLLNKNLDGNLLKRVNGIILIDEFGIHLHPTLQSAALTRLQETFPNVQFIITTHSPLLLNGLRKEQIHIIEINKDGLRFCSNPDKDIVGMGANEIFTEIFGMETTMDREFIQWNEEYTDLFDKKKKKQLNKEEEIRFKELSTLLAPLRLDPELKLTQEDPISLMVKEKLAEKTTNFFKSNLNLKPESIEKQVDDILGNIFNDSSF